MVAGQARTGPAPRGVMPCVWARNSAVMPIISAPLLVRVKSFGLRSMPASIGMWCMCSRPPTICTSSAPATIECAAWSSACRLLPQRRLTVAPPASTGRPAIRPTVRATLSPARLLLRVAEDRRLRSRRVDAGPLDQRADHRDGQVVGADVAKDALLRVGAANRRAAAINDDGSFHRFNQDEKRIRP